MSLWDIIEFFGVTRGPVQRELKVLQTRNAAYVLRWDPPDTFGGYHAVYAAKRTGDECDAVMPPPKPRPRKGTPQAEHLRQRAMDEAQGVDHALPTFQVWSSKGVSKEHVAQARARNHLGPWAGL